MKADSPPSRWRFSLRTLIVVVFILCVLGAANLTHSEPQLMFRFKPEDGGGAMYGTNVGWPVPYLRIPVGEHAHVPADIFAPGLVVNLAVAMVLISLPFVVPRLYHRFQGERAKLA